MYSKDANERVAQIEEVVKTAQGGVYKRLDENRQLLELLKAQMPDFLAKNFWVEGWLARQDMFLLELLATVPVEKLTIAKDFPRPWPTESKEKWGSPLDPQYWGLPDDVLFRMTFGGQAAKKPSSLEDLLQFAAACGLDAVRNETQIIQLIAGIPIEYEGSLLRFEQITLNGQSVSWAFDAHPLQQVTISLQGTRYSDPQAILDLADIAIRRIRNGDLVGEESSDGFGYRFEVRPASQAPSLLTGMQVGIPDCDGSRSAPLVSEALTSHPSGAMNTAGGAPELIPVSAD